MRLFLSLLVAPALSLACSVDNSTAALSGRIDGPMLQIQSSTVGADAMGGFSLQMELGDYASEDTQVSLGTFTIDRGDSSLVGPLSLAGATFPVSLGVGKKVMLPMTFTATIDPTAATTICSAEVNLQGTLVDSASHITPVASGDFSATCN